MITIAELVAEYVRSSPYIEEALANDLINLSSLARQIQPTLEQKLYKSVQTGAIVMALKRLSAQLPQQQSPLKQVLSEIKDLTVRSNIMEFTFANSLTLAQKQAALMQVVSSSPNSFLTISDGVFECSLFCSANLAEDIKRIFEGEILRSHKEKLSSITLILPESATYVPGVYYSILKYLAWEGINFIEVISSFTELTIFLEEQNVDKAFSVLKRL